MVRVRVFVCQCIGVDNGAGMSLAVCGQWCGYVVNALNLRDKGEPGIVTRESLGWQGRSIGVVHGVAWLGLFGVACNVVVSHTFVFTGYGSHLSLAVPHKLTSLPNTW